MKIKDPTAQWRFRRVPQLDNLELLYGSNITHDYPLHMHEEYCIMLVLKGAETTSCQGASYTAFPGSLALLNPEEVHSSRSVGARYRIIRMRPNLLRRLESELFGGKVGDLFFPKLLINETLIFRSLLNLHLKLEQNVTLLEQESEFISAIGLLLARLIKNHSLSKPTGKEPRYIKLARDYLRSRYAENVSLSQLSAITNLSPSHLLRVFHHQVGFPPHEYQTQVRIAHARKLLLEGQSISQVALETGFFDQSHLSRNFKRIVGMTPGQFLSQSNIIQDPAR